MTLPAWPWLRIASYALLIAVVGCLYFYARAEHASAVRWEERSKIEAQSHRTTKANVEAAQAVAAEAARNARLAAEAHSRQLAERADNAEHDLAAARAAASRFADARRMPVRPGGASTGAASNTRAAGEDDLAARGDRPGPDALVLRRGEYDQLVSNTLRLEQVRRWGDALISEGLAAPSPTSR